ncbi:hypothetical protein GH5_02513 [Leishmania sp. Ghana 2012 LV757]|uniref:hypothetical protein n=1 Tax=Leishmania sp. Ghana 2012 LV757 TaxID=2803181 RepID=UPI001B5806E4|nr:hypothetical protein GH5_02513 [Leishmania sp. Ghana 2012 LV757]
MSSPTKATPALTQPVKEAKTASGATQPADAPSAPRAREISETRVADASAVLPNADVRQLSDCGALRQSGDANIPAGSGTPGSQLSQRQQTKGDFILMGGGYGNSVYHPSVTGGYGSMCDFGGMSAAQPGGYMYGGKGGIENGMLGYCSMAGCGSMYGGMSGNPMGSMYGIGGLIGSMYGMDGPMGSMYGMGGPMGSMYGMGGPMGYMMARSMSFSSYGGNSIYGSMGSSSLMSIGGSTRSIGGMWGAESCCQVRRCHDRDMPTMAKLLQDDKEEHKRLFVTATAKQTEKDRQLPMKGAAAALTNGAITAEGDEKVLVKSDQPKSEEREGAEGTSLATANREAALTAAASAVRVGEDKGGVADRNRIHGIVIVENPQDTAVTVEKAEAGPTVSLKMASGKPAQCRVDEVMEGVDLDMSKSAVLSIVSSHLRSGHNVALIALDKRENVSAAAEKAIVAFYAASLGQLGADQEWKVTFSASAMSGTNRYRDLQDVAAAEAPPSALSFGSNPIFGACIMNLKRVIINDVEAVRKHVSDVLAKKTRPEEIVFMQAIVRILKGDDSFICSMNAFVVRDSETAEAIAILDDRRVPVPVLRPAVRGAARTAAIISISGAAPASAEEAEAMRILDSLCMKESLPPRSGNVQRFIEYTNEQIGKIEKEMATLTGAEKDRRVLMVEKMRTMANDARELIGNMKTDPKVYPIHSKRTAPSAAPATAAEKESNAVGAAAAPAVGSEGVPQIPQEALQAQVPVSTPASPFSSIHRLVYLQEAKAPSVGKAVKVMVDGETKAYDVDECIDSPAGAKVHSVEDSGQLGRMAAVLAAGFNVALLGAEFTAPAQPDAQMTWKYVRHLLVSVLTSATPETTTDVTLHMSVVHEREVLQDLVSGDAAPRRLVVATSPLFGPVVHGSTGAKVSTPEEVEEVMSKALANARSALKDGAMIVMTAVVRQLRKDDVMVASVFAVSAADLRPYKGVLEHNSSYSRTLFTYALGGPSTTGVLITASRDMDLSELASALSMQRSVAHVRVPASRSGSVREFVQYARSSLERQEKAVAAATEPAEKEAAANSLRRLTASLRDHEELLANPKTAEAKAYPPEPAAAGASSAVAIAHPEQATAPPVVEQLVECAAETQCEEPQNSAAKVNLTVEPASLPQEGVLEKPQPADEAKPQEEEEPPQPPSREEPQTSQEKKAHEEGQHKAAHGESTQAVRVLAVITEDMSTSLQVKEGWSVDGSGEQLVVTDVEGLQSFSMDEVVLRQNRGSPIDSRVLEELRHRFLRGDNVALLTAETRGSAASLEMIDRTVRHILGKMPPSNSLFMSLCALKESDSVVLDTLTEGGEFTTLEVNTSPLFGPSVAGATFVKVSVVEQFSKLMGAGLRKCGESRACVVLQVVQVEMKEGQQDINVSSLLALMCPGDISIYRHALDQSVKERGLLSLVLSGSCHTVFAVGLTKQPVDEGCLILSHLAQAFKGSVRNFKPRDGSVKGFIEHTRRAVAQMQKNCESATSEEDKVKMQGYIAAVTSMVEKSEAYLADPVGKMPPSFSDARAL